MLKKLLSMVLLLSVFSVHAEVNSQNSLKKAFDELNYSLSVEWDQKDKAFYSAQMEKFSSTVKNLQATGMTNLDLVNFAKSQIKDKNLAKDLETAFSLISINKMSPVEARKFVLDTISKSYNGGAHWYGDALLVGAVVVLILVVAIAAAGNGGGNGGYYNGGYYGCYETYVCYDYYDSWGYYWYTDCYYTCY